MIIIKHNNGWSCSNSAYIDHVKEPVFGGGKTISFKTREVIKIEKPYTVKGSLEGEVSVAIQDSSTGKLIGFRGVVKSPELIDITERNISTKFLLSL